MNVPTAIWPLLAIFLTAKCPNSHLYLPCPNSHLAPSRYFPDCQMSQQPFLPRSNSHLALSSNTQKMCQQPIVQCLNSHLYRAPTAIRPFLAINLTAKCANIHLSNVPTAHFAISSNSPNYKMSQQPFGPYSNFPDHHMSQQLFVPCPNSPFGSF